MFQSYHKSKIVDWADVSFYHNDELKNLRFKASDGDLSWHHGLWKWDRDAWQCAPLSQEIIMENDDYLISIEAENIVRGQISALRSLYALKKGQIQKSIEHSNEALVLLPENMPFQIGPDLLQTEPRHFHASLFAPYSNFVLLYPIAPWQPLIYLQMTLPMP